MRKKIKEKGVKIKKRSVSSLKKQAWDLCSEYIRRKYANPDGLVACVCCGKFKHWKKRQAGHLVPGRKIGILFDERGIFPCCYGCNIMKGGNIQEYNAFIDKEFGREYRLDLVDDLRRKSKEPVKWESTDYENKIIEYQEKLRILPI